MEIKYISSLSTDFSVFEEFCKRGGKKKRQERLFSAFSMPTIFRKRLILFSYARSTVFKEEIQKLKEMLKVETYQ